MWIVLFTALNAMFIVDGLTQHVCSSTTSSPVLTHMRNFSWLQCATSPLDAAKSPTCISWVHTADHAVQTRHHRSPHPPGLIMGALLRLMLLYCRGYWHFLHWRWQCLWSHYQLYKHSIFHLSKVFSPGVWVAGNLPLFPTSFSLKKSNANM